MKNPLSLPPLLPSVGVVSLGCPKNLVDTEVMLGHLQREGLTLTDPEKSRVVIVNTCGFIDSAKEESVGAILREVARKEAGEIDRVVVAGCMVQKYGNELAAEIPEVDHFIGLDELENAPAAALGLPSLPRFTRKPLATRLYDELSPRVLTHRRGYAYLKVAEGCNNPCTFCTIPQMRGLMRSRTVASLVKEAQGLEVQGVKELVLISQDTTRYGEDLGLGRKGLATLVENLLRETSFPWIRFLYAYPKTLHPGVFELMAKEKRFVPYVDMPLQHVSRKILASMKRGGDAASYLRQFEEIRKIVPEIALRSTFIVGFPGERDQDFLEVKEFLEAVRFENAGVFTYSPEPGSGSEALGDPVPFEEKSSRRDRLMEVQQKISLSKNRAKRGQSFDALLEGPSEETEMLLEARLAAQAPEIDGRVLVNEVPEGWAPRAGEIVRVAITEAHPYDLVGKIVA
ncbi:MAG TPA: 30S ribosomal protein S12 methylthiotransferase RimO [Thermoanaerobaculia bacterium]|nr:30S ribosomal protein S12 methylthiotransferase RimO [Thermoanaerobaculia bacterium]